MIIGNVTIPDQCPPSCKGKVVGDTTQLCTACPVFNCGGATPLKPVTAYDPEWALEYYRFFRDPTHKPNIPERALEPEYLPYYSGHSTAKGRKKLVQCKYCGKTGLHWEMGRRKKWRLHDDEGKEHHCPERGLGW